MNVHTQFNLRPGTSQNPTPQNAARQHPKVHNAERSEPLLYSPVFLLPLCLLYGSTKQEKNKKTIKRKQQTHNRVRNILDIYFFRPSLEIALSAKMSTLRSLRITKTKKNKNILQHSAWLKEKEPIDIVILRRFSSYWLLTYRINPVRRSVKLSRPREARIVPRGSIPPPHSKAQSKSSSQWTDESTRPKKE
jgi:hypothetical protein